MSISINFFAYDDTDRQRFHPLNNKVNVNSLAGFQYGQRFIMSEAKTDGIPQNYRVAALPSRRFQPAFLPDVIQSIDIYLAREEQWLEFTPFFKEMDKSSDGAGIRAVSSVYPHRLAWNSASFITV